MIGATGMDSLPADLGIHYMRQKFDGDLNHVDAVLSIKYGPQVCIFVNSSEKKLFRLRNTNDLKVLYFIIQHHFSCY